MLAYTESFRVRINRNIVECKVYYSSYRLVLSVRINRNIVECKVRNAHKAVRVGFVLIETSWNVKSIRSSNKKALIMY